MGFILRGHVAVHSLDSGDIARAFDLMTTYSDRPMSFTDASLITIAEKLRTLDIFTLDYSDFSIYRIKKGYRLFSPRILR